MSLLNVPIGNNVRDFHHISAAAENFSLRVSLQPDETAERIPMPLASLCINTQIILCSMVLELYSSRERDLCTMCTLRV